MFNSEISSMCISLPAMRVLLSDDRVNINIYTLTPQICREIRQSGSKSQSVIHIYLKRANISFSYQHLSQAGQHLIWGSTFIGTTFLFTCFGQPSQNI